MKLINHIYESESELDIFIEKNSLSLFENILLQVFTGNSDIENMSFILEKIKNKLPQICIIGASTAGEICYDRKISGELLLSFSLFEKTKIRVGHTLENSFEQGIKLAEQIKSDSKCIIVLGQGLKDTPVDFIKGVGEIAPHITVCGGNAGDNKHFKKTFVIHDDQVFERGLVFAILDSEVLKLHTTYTLNWHPFGREFEITLMEGNYILELDGTPIKGVVAHYFGAEVLEGLPESLWEFPLLSIIDGISVARTLINVEGEKFLYAGDFKTGDRVRFGICDIVDMRNNALKIQKSLARKSIEAVYVYSCAVRFAFLGDDIDYELKAMAQLGEMAGFFTYGEFYHTKSSNQMLNVTSTFLTLSESSQAPIPLRSQEKESVKNRKEGRTLRTLTHLVSTMTCELDENINFLANYKKAIDESSIVSKIDTEGRITYVNDTFLDILGFDISEVIGNNLFFFKHPDISSDFYQNIWNTITNKKVWQGITKNISKNNKTFYMKSTIIPMLDLNGDILEYIIIRNDITKIITQEQIINEQLTDPLTRLPNKIKMLRDIDNELIDCLAIIDFDNFWGIRDIYGFETADKVSMDISAFIRARLNNDEVLYRYDGDRFAVSLRSGELYEVTVRLEDILTELSNHLFKIGEFKIYVTPNSGLAFNTEKLITSAEAALRNAHETGMLVAVFIQEALESSRYVENIYWLNEVKQALKTQNILTYFQEIRSLKHKGARKFEALVRLRDSKGKVYPPARFLPIVKQTSDYANITMAVIDNIARASLGNNFNYSINISAQDLCNSKTMLYLTAAIAKFDIGNRLTLELLESELLEDRLCVNRFIKDFKALGCKVALDDFGSGYSNFLYLAEFEFDYLKIDGSIVKNIINNKNALITLETILDIARRLGFQTIAEFVADKNIYEKLEKLGVDYVQGYYIGKPEPLEKLQ